MSTLYDIRLPDPRSQRAGIRPFVIVSADSHAGLPTSEYLSYLDPKYRVEATSFIEDRETWQRIVGQLGYPIGQDVLDVVDTRGALRNGGEEGFFDPERRLRESEAEGVVAEFLHPGGNVGSMPFFTSSSSPCSPELRAAGARAHNRFLVDFCSVAPERLFGVHCVYPWPDAEAAAAACYEARAAGARAIFPAQQAGVPGDPCPAFYDPFWDPFWAACQDLDLVIHVHAGLGRGQGEFMADLAAAFAPDAAPKDAEEPGGDFAAMLAEAVNSFYERRPLWQLMLGGVFDRFPRLKVSFVEIHGDWVPPTLAYLDSIQDRFKGLMRLKASEYWERHCAIGASLIRQTDVVVRHEVGIDRLMFGTDYPHTEGSWPNTIDWLRATLSALPEAEARGILGENAIAWYGLDRAPLERVARRVGPFPADILGEHHVDPEVMRQMDVRGGILKTEVAVNRAKLVATVEEDAHAVELARLAN